MGHSCCEAKESDDIRSCQEAVINPRITAAQDYNPFDRTNAGTGGDDVIDNIHDITRTSASATPCNSNASTCDAEKCTSSTQSPQPTVSGCCKKAAESSTKNVAALETNKVVCGNGSARVRKDQVEHKVPESPASKHREDGCQTQRCCWKTSDSQEKNLTHSLDLEKNHGFQKVSFLVTGMDCTSCVDKLTRVFDSMAGVNSSQINFIVGNGEVTIDTSVTTPEQALRFASTASGFNLTRVVEGDYYLDVLVDKAQRRSLVDVPPDSALSVQVLDKKTIRLSYEPTEIGARELLDSIADRCGGLAPPRGDAQLANSWNRLRDQLSKTVLASILTIPIAVIAWREGLVEPRTRSVISFILGTLVQLIAVPEFYRPALSSLWYRPHIVEMDMLVVISITAAYGYSTVAFGFAMAGHPLDQSEFFETSSMLISLILLGRLMAAFARVQAVAAVSIRSYQSNTAILEVDGLDREIDARLLQYGDKFKILPHSRIPTDGMVLSGVTEVNESMLTGESMPVVKRVGDSLIASTINGDGTVLAKLTRLPGKNTVTDIAQMVENASEQKPKIQDLANKVAGYFVPVMTVVAILVFAIWLGCGLGVLKYSTSKAIANAITYAVATLAVACPCALGLAVPMVLVIAGGIAARVGIIIKSAQTTERARLVTDVVFDKTGTLTEPELVVTTHIPLADSHETTCLATIKALVAGGKHPVSAAVDRYLDDKRVEKGSGVSGIRVIPGVGIEAKIDGELLQAGNARWTKTVDHPDVHKLQQLGLTTFVVTRNATPLVVFGLRTEIRPESYRVVDLLKSRNITIHLVSGDQMLAAKAVALAVGIPLENAVGEHTPAEKRTYVESLMKDPTRCVMFCGDGTNDAVAVAQAHVGVQIGGANTSSDITQGAADVVLLNGLDGIPTLLDLSKESWRRILFNFIWSAIYNVLAVTMASGAWVKFRIAPQYAGIGEVASVLPVILASASLYWARLEAKRTDSEPAVSRK